MPVATCDPKRVICSTVNVHWPQAQKPLRDGQVSVAAGALERTVERPCAAFIPRQAGHQGLHSVQVPSFTSSKQLLAHTPRCPSLRPFDANAGQVGHQLLEPAAIRGPDLRGVPPRVLPDCKQISIQVIHCRVGIQMWGRPQHTLRIQASLGADHFFRWCMRGHLYVSSGSSVNSHRAKPQ